MEGQDTPWRHDDAETDRIVDRLSTEEQVGQLLVAPVAGTAVDASTADLFRQCHIGSAILFAANIATPAQTRALTARFQELCGRPDLGLPALIAVDQEGGRVQRLKPPATNFPSAMAVGATGSPDHARRWGLATARELRALGINLDFAPVLDINSNPANPVIGTRAYGERPDLVARMGLAALDGLRAGGVLATAKHFPGHGDTHVDSHLALPRIERSLEELRAVELAPFQAAIAAGIPAIMSAHIVFPALGEGGPELPATMSRAILTGLLRDELGFDGAIVSDAVRMQAIADRWGVVEGSVAFIAAGGDLVEPLADDRAVYAALLAAVHSGRIPRDQLRASVHRVVRLKRWVAAQGPADPAWLGAAEHRAWAAAIARDAVTLLRDDAGLLPLPASARLAVLDCVQTAVAGLAIAPPETSALADALRPRFPQARGVVIDGHAPTPADLAAARAAAEAADLVILGTRAAGRLPAQAAFANAVLVWGKPTVAVALAEPYDLAAYPAARTALATYGADPAMLAALADRLSDERRATSDE